MANPIARPITSRTMPTAPVMNQLVSVTVCVMVVGEIWVWVVVTVLVRV